MRFLFTCTGTAGHINPALAVAGRLREAYPDAQFLFVGSGREMERRLVPAAGYDLKNITITGFARGFSPSDIKSNMRTVINLAVSKKESRRIVEEFKPDVVIGTGGYVCYPILKAAARAGIPTALHESNAVPGLTTKMLSGVVDKMMVAFPDVSSSYKRPERVVFTGTPIRRDFLPISKAEAKQKLGVVGKPLVVSFWGSLGADDMNRKMADFIKLNSRSGEMWHIHATGSGEKGVARMVERLGEIGVYGLPQWEDLRAYIDNMGLVMTAADLVLCRAGASTIAEITALGKAAIVVPSPNVTDNHQEKNARKLQDAGGCVMVTEDVSSGEGLYNLARGILTNRERLESLEKGAKRLGKPEALTKICETVISMLK